MNKTDSKLAKKTVRRPLKRPLKIVRKRLGEVRRELLIQPRFLRPKITLMRMMMPIRPTVGVTSVMMLTVAKKRLKRRAWLQPSL